jgi:hypothetical protein
MRKYYLAIDDHGNASKLTHHTSWLKRFNNESIHYVGLLVDIVDQAAYLTAGESVQWEMVPGTYLSLCLHHLVCVVCVMCCANADAHAVVGGGRLCATGARVFVPVEAQDGHQRMENEGGDAVRFLADAESSPLQHLHQSPLLQNQHQRRLLDRKYYHLSLPSASPPLVSSSSSSPPPPSFVPLTLLLATLLSSSSAASLEILSEWFLRVRETYTYLPRDFDYDYFFQVHLPLRLYTQHSTHDTTYHRTNGAI